MILSYKVRQFLRRLLVFLLVAALLVVLALALGSIWLRRFVIYTPQGAVLNMDRPGAGSPGVVPTRPDRLEVNIVYPQETMSEVRNPHTSRVDGYYITAEQMQADLPGLRRQIAQLPAGTAIMLDVKSFWGYFYYSSSLGPGSENFILSEVDHFIGELTASELYVIARLPALRDYEYALANVSSGLATANGYLWADEKNCYWLDPTDDGTLTYLIQITKELRDLGFDEVVFQDFYIPQSGSIAFDADRKEAVESAAATLVTACATERFTVSFFAYRTDLMLPQPGCRLYLTDVAAVEVQDVLAQVTVGDRARGVVFLAQTNDTRYNVCGALRPLELAH
jgi:hypothetical protein